MFRLLRSLGVFIILVATSLCSIAQENPRFDSLVRAAGTAQQDSQKVAILLKLSSLADCAHKIQYAVNARDLSDKSKWMQGAIRSNMAIGHAYFSCGNNYAKALSCYILADSLAKREKDNRSEVLALGSIASIYQKNGQYKQAIDYYRQVLALKPDDDNEIGAWGNLGVAYNSIGDYGQALNSYYNSLRVLDRINKAKKNDVVDSIQIAGLLLNIGDVHMEMGHPDKAFGNYDSVYKLGIITHYKLLEVIGLMGMGEVYIVKKNYAKAIAYFQTAATSNAGLNDYKNEIKILAKLANAYMGKGELSQAMEFAQRSLKLAEEKANNEQLPKIYITLGKVYGQQHDYTNAVSYLQKALDIARQTAALDDEKEAWFALSNTYEQMNDPAKALTAYKQFIGIRDSVYNIAKANEITRQELDFYYKDKQTELDRKISQQQTYTYLGVAGLILLVLLSFFIYRNYNTQRKYNKLLSKEKVRHLQHIEAQDTVLSDIAHMQSHNVRGPVATILGLVQIFNKENLADPINKDIIDGLTEVTEKLDVAVKEVIIKENRHKNEQGGKK
jgi:tetratricopeptide (TPR) repeat protein